MRAAVFEPGKQGLVIEEIDIADPARAQVRVRVHYCSVCHSDYSMIRRRQGRGPTVLGHEAAGVVDAVGPGVTTVAPGDKVVISPTAPCGRCYFCVDYAFDAAGVARLAETGIRAVRHGGTTVLVGVPGPDEAITIQPVASFLVGGKKLIGCLMGDCNSLRDIPRFLAMWQAGRLDLNALVSQRRPLEEINEALTDLHYGVGIRTAVSFLG